MLFVCLCLLALPPLADAAEKARVAVLSPDVPEPYTRIFSDIFLGIESAFDGEAVRLILAPDATREEVKAWLDHRQISQVIALGNQAMDLVLDLPENYVTVTGAVLSVGPPEEVGTDFAAITLAPDPALTFAQLKELAPSIEVVSVVYEQSRHARLIARATDVAATYGITLELHKYAGDSDSSQVYRDFFKNEDNKRRAVWLLQGDPTLNRSVLYNLLKDAWYSKLLVFSNNPSYVKKGILFSLFPDNVQMGKSLVQTLTKQKAGNNPGVIQARDLLSALNTRTADHLGLQLSRSRRREFDVIFPSR
jgi:putative ABC transport system substrate-binding protein